MAISGPKPKIVPKNHSGVFGVCKRRSVIQKTPQMCMAYPQQGFTSGWNYW